MPEFEPRRSSVPPFVPPARPASGASSTEDAFAASAADLVPQREGLPPTYRMRNHHLVDELTSRLALPQIRVIPIRDIDGTRVSESRGIEPQELEPLVRSIATLGLLQPLLVRSRSGRFDLIAGSKRLAAAAAAGLTEVPCLVYTCDDQRARAFAEADNLRIAPEPVAEPPTSEAPGPGLKELQHTLGTIESCLHLLVDRDTSLRDRVALDLIRTEAHRARRLVQCLNTLTAEPALSLAPQPLRLLVDQALDAFGPERRLSGVQVQVETLEGPAAVAADPEWFGVAVAGLLGGMLALVQNTRTPALHVRISRSPAGDALLEMSQQVVTVPAWALSRFFDANWTERPGGYQAAVELAAAKRIVELHRGSVELTQGERAGCRLAVSIPSST